MTEVQSPVAWFGKRRTSVPSRRQAKGTLDRAADSDDRAHLEEWARSRQGVEAYLEPPTTVTTSTLVLIAHDGEWTRRRVPDGRTAHDWAHKLGIPFYDARIVGYPQRMRDYNSRQRSG